MISRDDIKTIKKLIEDFLEKMTFEADVDVLPPTDGNVSVRLKIAEPQILIGEGGQTLMELQHILKIFLKKSLASQEPFFMDLDINDYKEKKIEYLKETAKSVADEVTINGKEQQLPPMTPYERRVVHMELAAREDVIAESIGQEPNRRLVIKPRS